MQTMLLKFLKNSDRKQEFELYLDIFTKVPKMRFAVIKISGGTLENHLDGIAEDIAYLNKLEMYPIIVHGAGSVLDKKLPSSKKIDGLRVTSESDMEIVKQVFNDISSELARKINEKGGSAEKAPYIFDSKPLNDELGCVGKVKNIDVQKIQQIIGTKTTPIVSPVGVFGSQYHNINADTAAKELVKVIDPIRFILMTETGGILDKNKQIIPFLNLYSDDDLSNISGGMLLKVEEIKDFLKEMETDCAVVITSADNLLREIFTIKGGGTFIKFYTINTAQDAESVDKEKLKILLEKTYDKTLVSDYFENGIKDIFYQKDYYGVAIIKEVSGKPYLDKFAVAKHWQGTGLGKSLWQRILAKYPTIVWRARPDNHFNASYVKTCDGMMKTPDWYVYWKNLEHDEVVPIVKEVSKIKKTLLKEGESDEL